MPIQTDKSRSNHKILNFSLNLYSRLLIQPGFWVYWQTLFQSVSLVPGGPTENMTRSPPIALRILTPQTEQVVILLSLVSVNGLFLYVLPITYTPFCAVPICFSRDNLASDANCLIHISSRVKGDFRERVQQAMVKSRRIPNLDFARKRIVCSNQLCPFIFLYSLDLERCKPIY
jgi:hypothetical protein